MVVEEGRARLYVPPSVFYSKHQELQRDLSVSVLRALRRVEYRQGDVAEVGRDAFKVKLDAVGGDIPDFPLSRLATESPAPNAGKVLRVCDALAGTGVRAIRYALEAGPVQVVANDKSAEACGAIVQSAFLSGIERIDHFTANGSQTMDEGSAGAPGTASPQGPTVKIVNSRRSESDAVTSCSRFRLGSVASCGDKVGGETSLPSASEVSLRIDSKTAAETALDAPPPPAARVPGSDPVQPSFAVRLGDANDLLLSPTELDKPKSAPQTAGRGWDLVDVDPFGSCAGFLEAATSAVADGGVLAVASTDLAVLCGKKGTKACLERYGARVADRAYSKEAALRVLLHRMDVIARRQERRIIPLLCAALEFYVRLFVMVVPLGEDLSEKDATSSPPPLVVIQSLHSPEFSLRYLSSERSIDEASAHPASPEPGKSGQRTCVMDAVVLGDHLNPESGSKGFRAGRRGRTLHAATELGTGKCESQGRDEVSANSKPSVTLGPFWSGPLFHRGFVAVVIREVRLSAETNGDDRGSMASTAMSEIGRTRASLVQGGESRSERHGDHGDRDDRGDHGGDGAFASSVALLRTRRQLLFLLETLTSEVDDSPLFFSIPELVAVPVTRRSSLAKRGGRRRRDGDARSSNPTVEAVLAELRAEGFVCSSSHVDPRGIKTAAPLAAVQRALSSARSAQGVNVDGSSARAAIGSLQAARNQLPQSVGINCRPGTDVTGSVAPGGSGDWPSGQPSETYLGSCLRSESCISCLPREARTREPSAVHAVPDVEVSSEGSRVSDPKNLRNVSTRKLVEGKDGSPCAGSILASPCDRDDTDHPSSTSQVCGTPVGCSRGGRIRKRGALEAHPGERPGEAPRPVGPCLTGVKLSGVEAAATVATGAGPRVPLGRFSYPPDLSHFESSPNALLSDGATSGGETRTIQKGGGDKSEHVSLATLEQFVESALTEKAASCADAHAATPVSSADDAMARPEFSADEVICFLIVRPAGTERVAVSRGCSFPREEGCTRGRGAKGDVEASVSQRFPQHVRFMASVEEACRVSNEAASDGCKSRVTILLLGGEGEEIYDAGRRGVVLAGAGASLIGVAGVNGHLPVLEGRADAPVIRCTGDRVSIRSLKIRGGVATGGENEGNSRGFPLGRSCAPHEDDSSSGIHSRRPPFNGGDDHEFRGQDDFGSHTSDCNSSARLERKGGIGREEGSGMNSADALPEVVRWRDGAKDFLVKQASATCGAGRRTVAAVAKDEPSAGTALAALKHAVPSILRPVRDVFPLRERGDAYPTTTAAVTVKKDQNSTDCILNPSKTEPKIPF